jgi:O-antigen ligase
LGTGYSSIGLASDNDYLRSLAEVGLLGTAAFGLIFIRWYIPFFKTAWRPSQNIKDVFVLSVGCGLLALLMNAVFIDVFEASKIAIITWTLLGLSQKAQTLHE